MEVVRLYLKDSAAAASGFPRMIERSLIRIRAGCSLNTSGCIGGGLGKKGPITFFSEEIWHRLEEWLSLAQADMEVLGRNIVVRGVDLPGLVGRSFAIQHVRFAGLGVCRAQAWMDRAVWPGTSRLLRIWNAGGLKAVALDGGVIVCDAAPAGRCHDSN